MADELVSASHGAEMLDVTCGGGKPRGIVDNVGTELTLPGEQQAQPMQHLVFRNGDIPLGHNFLVPSEEVWINHRG